MFYDGANFHFNTTYGVYSWIQPLNIMRFSFRNGSEFISESVFILQENSSGSWLSLLNFQNIITVATNNSYLHSYRVAHRYKGQNYVIANVSLTMQFFFLDPPKISFSMSLTDNWSLLEFNNFRVVWDIIPAPPFKYWINEIDLSSKEIPSRDPENYGKFKKIALSREEEFNINKTFLRISWLDLDKECEVIGGREAYFNTRGIIILFPVNEGSIDPTTVSSQYGTEATGHVVQKRLFNARNLEWVFFYNASDHVYFTSNDSVTWIEGLSSPIRNGSRGGEIAYDLFNETDLHYVYAPYGGNGSTYRMGILETNSSISWLANETALGGERVRYPTIVTDNSGYAWIGYEEFISTIPAIYAKTSKNSLKNGSWSHDTGFPFTLHVNAIGKYYCVLPAPLNNSECVAIISMVDEILRYRFYNGSSWDPIKGLSTSKINLFYPYCFSGVTLGDLIHITFEAMITGVGWPPTYDFEVKYVEFNATTIIVTNSPSNNSGAWLYPERAYVSDNSRANSPNENEEHIYWNYGFDDNIPSGAIIKQVSFGVEAYDYNDQIEVYYSNNSGSSFTLVGIVNVQSSETLTWLNIGNWLYGRAGLLDVNFRVKIKHIRRGGTNTIYLDWLPVRVSYGHNPESEILLEDMESSSGHYPVISANQTSLDLYVFYDESEDIFYRFYNATTDIWEARTSWVSEEQDIILRCLSGYTYDMNGRFALIWIGKFNEVYGVRHHYLPFVEIPIMSSTFLILVILFFFGLCYLALRSMEIFR